MTKALVIAGTSSGVGKTTIASGLIGTWRQQGLRVQPFKAGPDYIDPMYHAAFAGVPSRNLDSWLLSSEILKDLFNRAVRNAGVAVVEGVMGLYDGRTGAGEEGSTAEVAKLLGLPVFLVIDASKVARSVAATALGFKNFDHDLRFAGVILNGISSPGHYLMCKEAIEQAGMQVFGYLPFRNELKLPERHLGLIPTVENLLSQDMVDALISQTKATVDSEKMLSYAVEIAPIKPFSSLLFPSAPVKASTKIAIAQDKAFNFYYQDNLDLLEAWGAELVTFSPLADKSLPHGTSAVYIGGGFPELYAERLASNPKMLDSIRNAANQGMPIYAECGGLMYLGKKMVDLDGLEHVMAGILPASSNLRGSRLTIGYRSVRVMRNSLLLRSGEVIRGHEFHWSELDRHPTSEESAYKIMNEPSRSEGFLLQNILASYIHIHFGSMPGLAARFVEAAQRFANNLDKNP